MAHYFLVNHRHEFIACLSPKCACTSLQKWFMATEPQLNPEKKDDDVSSHMVSVHELADFKNYRRYLFVRDPLQRLVSFYCNYVVRQTNLWCFADDGGSVLLHDKTFREFLQILLDLARVRKCYQHHLIPQVSVMGTTNLLSIEPELQFVPIDDLNRELEKINDEYGFSFLPHQANKRNVDLDRTEFVCDISPHELRKKDQPPWMYFYDDAMTLLASQLYAHDLACYQESIS